MPTHSLQRRRRKPMVVLALTAALVTTSTSGIGAASATPLPGAARTISTPRFAAPAVPVLNWTDCGDGMQCAKAAVPLDYTHPAGRSVTLNLVKLTATDKAHRIGSLFVNPGGPGGSGADFVRLAGTDAFSATLRARFDVVGFDPRFVPASTPFATCTDDDEFYQLYPDFYETPITSEAEHRAFSAMARYNKLCAKNSTYLAYGSTANVARDLDLLRQAVGDKKLSYVGYSYGTVIGQTYAALFPTRIRSMVIDGVVDAKAWSTGEPGQSRTVPFTARLGSAAGSYATFQQFTRLCDRAGQKKCPFTTNGDARAKFDKLAAAILKSPLHVGEHDVIDYQTLISAVLSEMNYPPDWGYLGADLQTVYTDVFSTPIAASSSSAGLTARSVSPSTTAAKRSADALIKAAQAPRWRVPGLDDGTGDDYTADGSTALFSSVTCSDTVNPRSATAWSKSAAAQEKLAPYFGAQWTWSGLGCTSWKLPAKGSYFGPYDKATSAPVLVIGNTYDPATPYAGAKAVAARIPGARLLTINGYGHTSSAEPSECATGATDAYLIGGRLPAAGTVCHQDEVPFALEVSDN